MTTKILRIFGLFFVSLTIVVSCEDNDTPDVQFEERDRNEQQEADRDSLINYLETHYYNSGDFISGENYTYEDILITEMPIDDEGNYFLPDPDNNTILKDAVETHTTVFLDTTYEYYILRLNQGGGESPSFTDSIRYRFEGSVVENQTVFQSLTSPDIINLQTDGFTVLGAIRGWQLIIPTFQSSEDFNTGIDGVVNFNNYGLGVMFIPSGLGYFSASLPDIPPYSNLVFKFELLQYEVVDHESDGIPSFKEDINNDLSVLDDDTDGDGLANFVDLNDDGDSVSTLDELIPQQYIVDTNLGETEPVLGENEFELNRSTSNGVITINTVRFADDNNNGIPDHLDDTVEINYNEDEE
jgi:FKBP-type peptidyl-prolyl cis-trans isomerase FkpA